MSATNDYDTVEAMMNVNGQESIPLHTTSRRSSTLRIHDGRGSRPPLLDRIPTLTH